MARDRVRTGVDRVGNSTDCPARWGDIPVMRILSPRKIPARSDHHGSGQAVVRFVDHREGDDRGHVDDVYLGVHGSEGIEDRYEAAVRDWIRRSLEVGWAPAEWKPAETGHEGVLTVAELVGGYRRNLDRSWGDDWQQVEIDEGQVREYRAALDRARELMRAGRPRGDSSGRQRGDPRGRLRIKWGGDKEMFREGKKFLDEARGRYGYLDDGLERRWTARVLDDLIDDYGSWAAAVLGDRELRLLRKKWTERGVSLSDRKSGMKVVEDAYRYVIGRKPRAPWNLDRSVLEQNAQEFGLDLGAMGADGRWVRTG
jgi:hypothetical protein